MNNTFFTRKLVLGMLMALVLAFGVQGVADALTFQTTRTGDLQTLSPGQRFVVSFNVTLNPRRAVNPNTVRSPATQSLIDEAAGTSTPPDSHNHVGYSPGDTYYYTNVDPNDSNITVYNWLTEEDAFLLNEQQVTIDPTNAEIVSIGTYNVPSEETGSITLNQLEEWSDGRARLVSRISVTLQASNTPSAITIAITDATENGDLPGGSAFIKSVFENFRLYVLQLESDSRVATITGELDGTVVNDDQDTEISVTLTGAASDFARVGFEVYEGPGTLYEDKNDDGSPDSTPTKSITAFTGNHGTPNAQATVRLKTNRGTSKVRAWVFGNDPTTNVAEKTSRAIYIYRWTTLRKVSGDATPQRGVTETQLEHPFIVELTDANGNPISGQTITFEEATGGGSLEQDPNFDSDLYDTGFSTNGQVETNDNGRASVLLTLGNAAGANTVTATYDGATQTFSATAQAESAAASIEIVSGNNQSAGENLPLPAPLVVLVRDQDGLIISGQTVRFNTDSGVLSGPQSGDPGELVPSPTPANSGRNQTVNTDETGRASVNYNVGNVAGAARSITAILLQTYDNQTRDVVFTATRSGGTGPVTPPVTGNNLSISPSSITATAGSTRSVVVNANRNVAVTLSGGTGLSVLETGRTGSSISFTIPSNTASGTYILRATASGYNSASINVTVQGTQTSITPSLFPSSISGNARQVISVNVTLSGAGSNVRVDIGSPFNVFERTDSAGVARFQLRLPDTARSGTASVTASSYTTRIAQLSYTVTGTTPTTGTAVRLVLPSGATTTLSGAIGSVVQLRARVQTLAGVGVSGVAVTFQNSSNVVLATFTTDSNGEVSAPFSVQSIAQTVTATITGTGTNVDASGASTITFTISSSGVQQSTRLNIFQTSNTAGPGAVHPLTILMVTPNGTAAVNQVITLTVRDSVQALVSTLSPPLITGIDGRAATPDTFRLPTTPGVYTITATSGRETRSVTVTVVAIKLVKDTSDSVSGDNQEGDRGVVLNDPFVLKVLQDITTTDTPVQGVPVTFTVIDGDGELSTSDDATSGETSITVRSDANGEVQAYLVLGEDDEDNRVRARFDITDTTVADVFFDATGAVVPYDIEIVSGNNQQIQPNRYSDPMVVRVTDEDGDDLRGAVVTFSLRGGSGTLTPRSAVTDRNGEAEAELFPRATGTYFVDARVPGVTSVRFTITVGDLADTIEIVSGNNQSGEPGTELEDPLVVEVLDDDSDTVSGVTVTFSVTAGDGSLSETSVTTNSRGRAETVLTLGDEPGRNTVRASVSGVSDRVTFTATAEDPAPPEPDVRLPAAQRADTYWINTESGTLHRLVGNSVEDIAPNNIQDVVSLVVTDNRLYWVEKTGSSSGRIRRSNLNGGNIQIIRNLTTAPAGITVDTVNSKIYVTTERGKIQQINIDGSQYQPNLIVGLDTPKDIAVDAGSGKMFWITETGSVYYANLDGSGVSELASGYGTLGGIAVGGGKVYWTEETSDSAGKIHSANVDGSNVQELVSLNAAPYGISVDAAAKKLYWTNSRGKIMHSNLNGNSIRDVVKNLVSLGDVAVPAGATPTRPPGTFSKYDVNRDGTVDNTDAALVADALGESPPSNPRLDVNDDGRVNFLDLLLVFDNRDNTNAAPVAVAKLPKVSREEVQKQINLLLASDNNSLTAQHTLAYLQSLLEVVTPVKTRLLANYPNPFNPETWIPYQLGTSSDVQITIYNAAGRVVRTLTLGHQSEGYYTDQSRAAYWDGRNVIGERVSSGVYFYQLQADIISSPRKMLILK